MISFRPGLALIALTLAPALAQTAPADPGSVPLVRVKDARLPFTVSLPRTWVGVNLKDNLGGVTIVSRAQAGAPLMRLLFLPKNGKLLNLDTEFRNFEATVREAGASLKLQSQRPARYGGVAGTERVYAITGAKPGALNMRVWFGNGVRNFYSFQLTAPSAEFAKIDALFGKVLASVAF
ncbi:hypothetical protein [Deinococcus sp.]|uniref:hypothetical protein n=1 Tax=Deinococcus sp. TaxID=47478 RepID=UPI0025DAE712|nr:hypothetical protein [Deinococcus sp.]